MKHQRQRFLSIGLVLFSASFFDFAQASELGGINRNNQGAELLKQKKTYDAYHAMTDTLRDLPFNPAVHLNLALAFMESKDFEKAYKESLTAAQLAKDIPDIKMKAFFNAAVAATELKKIEEALSLYQQCLELEPNSLETKTNIELLTKSQQGGGQGDDQDKDQSGDDQKDQNKEGKGQKPPPSQNQRREYKGKEVNAQNMQKILDELKAQEEKIRGKFEQQGAKEAPRDKDW